MPTHINGRICLAARFIYTTRRRRENKRKSWNELHGKYWIKNETKEEKMNARSLTVIKNVCSFTFCRSFVDLWFNGYATCTMFVCISAWHCRSKVNLNTEAGHNVVWFNLFGYFRFVFFSRQFGRCWDRCEQIEQWQLVAFVSFVIWRETALYTQWHRVHAQQTLCND